MIRKLQFKFILINMLLITIVLVIIFIAVYASTQQRLANESMDVLHRSVMDADRVDPFPNEIRGPGKNPGGFMPMPTFTVQLNANHQIISAKGNLVDLSDEKALNEIVQTSLASDTATGIITGASLRYLKQITPDGMVIAFVDRSMEINTLASLVKTSVLVGIGSLLVFFFISLFLSRWALRPAEKAWEQQRQFVADASHELKTPLTVILANAGIVLSHKHETVAEQAKWIEYIQAEAERMTKLVDNLLFLAKTDEAKARVIMSRINFSDTVWGSILPFESVAFEQGKNLESDIAPDLYIHGDEGKLKQLVGILLDNACKYADEHGTITVKLYKNTEHRIKFSVSNTGAHIPPDQIEHIFERFFRVDKSRAREQGGYGLGLSIAQSIAAMHNSKISVHSTAETGTTFTVSLASAD